MHIKWLPVPGYEGFYEASTAGGVRSVDRVIILKDRFGNPRPCLFKGRELKQAVQTKPCYNWLPRKYVVLSKQGAKARFYVHQVIAITFIPKVSGKSQINHIDGNPFNNNVENLEWVTPAENIRHAFKNGLIHTAKPVAQFDTTTEKLLATFPSESEACRQMGVAQGKIRMAMQRNGTCKGYRWKYI